MPFDLATAKPLEQKGGFDLSSAKPVDSQQPEQSAQKSILDTIASVPLEFMAGVNRGATKIADFLTVDQINAWRQVFGKDPDVQTITQFLSPATKGEFMDPGLGRDIVGKSGEMVPAAMSMGAGFRGLAASQAPQVGGNFSTGQNIIRAMGSSTPAADAGYGVLSATGAESGRAIDQSLGGSGQTGALVGGIAAPLIAPMAAQGFKATIRGIFRGGEEGRQVVAQNIDDFARAGATPTVAEATQNPFLQGTENVSAKFIGGGPINRARETTSANIQGRLGAIADDISRTSGDEVAGLTIKRAITGPNGFVDRFNATQRVLWNNVDDAIGRQTPVELNRTTTVLDDMVSQTAIGQELNNPLLVRLRGAIGEQQTATYDDLAALRSSVGERLASRDLISDIPRTQLNRLYGAISQDIRAAAANSGDDVLAQYTRANNFTRSGHQRIDDFLQGVTNKVDLDKVFAAVSKGGEGAQVINSFKRSMRPEEWNVVVSNVVRKMGRATAGQQGAAGEEFSVQKFLTDWNKLGPARRALFSGSPEINQYGRDLDAIARTAENIKFGGREIANASGSGQFVANASAAGSFIGGAVAGNLTLVAGVLATITTNNLGARLFTNPAFVRSLAHVTALPNPSYGALAASLTKAAKQSDINDAVAINSLLEQLQGQEENTKASKPNASKNGK